MDAAFTVVHFCLCVFLLNHFIQPITIFISTSISNVYVTGQPIYCNTTKSCQSNSIIANHSGDALFCYGYRSCELASITSLKGGYIYCYGSYSCYHALDIQVSTSASSVTAVFCGGLSSCANVGLISAIGQSNDWVSCEGEQSCSNTTLISSSGVYCRGDRSCANSQLTGTYNFYLPGNLAAINGTLFTNTYDTFIFLQDLRVVAIQQLFVHQELAVQLFVMRIVAIILHLSVKTQIVHLELTVDMLNMIQFIAHLDTNCRQMSRKCHHC